MQKLRQATTFTRHCQRVLDTDPTTWFLDHCFTCLTAVVYPSNDGATQHNISSWLQRSFTSSA
eukprot:2026247-Amphidinium_carterae.1